MGSDHFIPAWLGEKIGGIKFPILLVYRDYFIKQLSKVLKRLFPVSVGPKFLAGSFFPLFEAGSG